MDWPEDKVFISRYDIKPSSRFHAFIHKPWHGCNREKFTAQGKMVKRDGMPFLVITLSSSSRFHG